LGSCSFSSTSGPCRVTLVKKPAISHEKRKGGTYLWSCVTQIYRNNHPWWRPRSKWWRQLNPVEPLVQ